MNNAGRFRRKMGLKRAQSVRAASRFYHSMIALIQRVREASVRDRRPADRRRSGRDCWR